MAALLQAISEILRPSLRLDGPIELQELDPGSRCEAIRLRRTGSSVVLKLDQPYRACERPGCQLGLSANDRMFPLFDHRASELCSVCDYVIFCQEKAEEALYVLLCDLKSGNVSGSRGQLENGRLLADYILAMAMHHRSLPSPGKIECRGVVFSPESPMPKGNLHKIRCSYTEYKDRTRALKIAHYKCGMEYPLLHFCA